MLTNYRSSGGYGRQDNYDRSGRYDVDSQTYNDRYTMNESSGRWPQDREHRNIRNYGSYPDRNAAYGSYNENRDYGNEGYNGRNASDYNSSSYGDRYYDPSDNYNRRDGRGYTYGHDEDYERENRRPKHRGRYSWGQENEDRTRRKLWLL